MAWLDTDLESSLGRDAKLGIELLADGNFAVKVSQAEGSGEYEFVAAGQAATALGASGAVGDYLEGLICIVATAATAQVQIKDGGDAAITIFPNNPGGGINTYPIPIGLKSRTGAWQVITGAGVSVLAIGNFS